MRTRRIADESKPTRELWATGLEPSTKTVAQLDKTSGFGRAAEILETGRRGEALYSREQREAALEAYDRLGDVRAAVRELGYPSDTALAGWVRRRGEAPRPRKPAVRL